MLILYVLGSRLQIWGHSKKNLRQPEHAFDPKMCLWKISDFPWSWPTWCSPRSLPNAVTRLAIWSADIFQMHFLQYCTTQNYCYKAVTLHTLDCAGSEVIFCVFCPIFTELW